MTLLIDIIVILLSIYLHINKYNTIDKSKGLSSPTISLMITDFFEKKRGAKRKIANKSQKKRKCLGLSSKKNSNNPVVDHNDIGDPIIVRVRRNEENEWYFVKDEEDCDSMDNHSENLLASVVNPKPSPAENLQRSNRINWHLPEYFPILVHAIENNRLPVALRSNSIHESGIIVPSSTIKSVAQRLGNREITVENCFEKSSRGLLSDELIAVLQDIIRKRDDINNGVSRKEAIQLIVDLGQCISSRSAENHLDYLIRKKKLTGLKRGGGSSLHRAQRQRGHRSIINRICTGTF